MANGGPYVVFLCVFLCWFISLLYTMAAVSFAWPPNDMQLAAIAIAKMAFVREADVILVFWLWIPLDHHLRILLTPLCHLSAAPALLARYTLVVIESSHRSLQRPARDVYTYLVR